jgi:hypothetical protein
MWWGRRFQGGILIPVYGSALQNPALGAKSGKREIPPYVHESLRREKRNRCFVSESGEGSAVPFPGRLFPLSWDQRHTLKVDAEFHLPFEIQANAVFLYNSPRPFTYYPTRDGFTPLDTSRSFLPNNARMFDVAFENAKLSRQFVVESTRRYVVTVYLNVRNLLNGRNVRWTDSNGRIGGELGDPSAYYDPRRVHAGVRLEL